MRTLGSAFRRWRIWRMLRRNPIPHHLWRLRGLLEMRAALPLGSDQRKAVAQVAFGTLVLMLGVLYTFMAKGWLR